VISSSQRPLPDNTQHSQQTDIHAPCGIRTHNLSMRAAADPRRWQRGHWDQQQSNYYFAHFTTISRTPACITMWLGSHC